MSGRSPPEPQMPRSRLRPRPPFVPKCSSLWFAMKAIQTQNSKHLTNNSSIIRRPFVNYNQSRSVMNGSDQSRDSHQKPITSDMNKNDSSLLESNDQTVEESAQSSNPSIDSEIEIFEIDEKKSLVLMPESKWGYELNFGCIRLTLLSNNYHIIINGYDLQANQSIDLMVAFGHKVWLQIVNEGSHLKTDLSDYLRTLGVKQFDSIVKRLEDNSLLLLVEKLCSPSLLYMENDANFKPSHLKSNTLWFEIRSLDSKSSQFVNVWDKLFDELNLCDRDVVIVTGGINVGKSSFIRHFINRFLSQPPVDECPSCYYLDCDPGQSEFSTSAQLSLTQVDRPLLSSATMNVLSHRPLMSYSVGATTPSKEPKLYISGVIQLVNFFKKNLRNKRPLFVNTMGWTRDLGLALLSDTIKAIQPTHVIQINSSVSTKVNFPFDLTPQSILKFPGFRFNSSQPDIPLDYKLSIITSDNRESKRSQMTRVSQQLTYFSRMPDIVFKPFFAMTPIKIQWSKVLLHVMSDTRLSSQLYLDALNLSWVHLCHIDIADKRVFERNGIRIIHSIQGNRCFGSAIVRGIDSVNRLFYLLTPEDQEVLESVNCIVRPSGVFIPDQMITEQMNYSQSSAVPYIYRKT